MSFEFLSAGEDSSSTSATGSASKDEAAWVVAQDVAQRRLPQAHVIAFANEKGGVGKSTMAFQTAIAMCHAGAKVLTIDCDHRQLTLDTLLDARDGAARALKTTLPRPRHIPLAHASVAMLLQEIERMRADAQFILIDLPGHDSPLTRRVVAMANTLVTPVNCSQADLAVLGRIGPIDGKLQSIGAFGQTVAALQRERIAQGLKGFDWIVASNRVRRSEQRLIAQVERDLETLSARLGFRTIAGLSERLAYRDLLQFGLSHLDLRMIPGFAGPRSDYLREVRMLLEGLRLPDPHAAPAKRRGPERGRAALVPSDTADRYRMALAGARPLATVEG